MTDGVDSHRVSPPQLLESRRAALQESWSDV